MFRHYFYELGARARASTLSLTRIEPVSSVQEIAGSLVAPSRNLIHLRETFSRRSTTAKTDLPFSILRSKFTSRARARAVSCVDYRGIIEVLK